MRIDRTDVRLAALRSQAEKLSSWEAAPALIALSVADGYATECDRVRGERYSPEREREELARARAAAVEGLMSVLAEIDRGAAAERDRTIDQHAAEQRTRLREGRRLSDVIDVAALQHETDVNAIRAAVETARAHGLGGEVRAIALRAVRPLAAREQRERRLNGPAFMLLCDLTAAVPVPMSLSDVAGRVDVRREALRGFVREVADAIGLGASFVREQTRAAAPAPEQRSTIVVGGWWDRHPANR